MSLASLITNLTHVIFFLTNSDILHVGKCLKSQILLEIICKKAYNILNGIICNFCDKVINGGGISKTLEVEVIHREMRSHEIDIEGSNVVSTPPHGELMRQQLVFPLLGEKKMSIMWKETWLLKKIYRNKKRV